MIPYGRQQISETDVAAVCEVLLSDYLTQGPTVPAFERAVAAYCGALDAVAVNSATSALHIACLALDLGPGDWLWTCPNTFVASANCARYCNANVDFVDIDPKTYNLCPEKLREKLHKAESTNTLPKVVVPVHFAGQPCDMAAIHQLAVEYDFSVIEDASHAIGSSYDSKKVGSCTHSDITVFSFHPVKIITTGEGGMAVTNNRRVADNMRRLRTHGITNDPSQMHARPADEIWNYQQLDLGFNYRMTDVGAALGLSQLNSIDNFISRRSELAKRYDELLKDLPVTKPWQRPGTNSAFHLYPICVTGQSGSPSQRDVYNDLRNSGIAVNLHYIPVHRHPYYERLGFRKGQFPEAERFHQRAVSLPIFSSLTNDQQDKIASQLAITLRQ